MAKQGNDGETILQVILGVFAILAIKSLFEHDNSKILSKRGSQVLTDKRKMSVLKEKLEAMDSNKENEIII